MRVFLADDQKPVRSAIRLLLEQETGMEIVGEAGDAAHLLAQVEQAKPHVILLDWELPGLPGGDLLRLLRFLLPRTAVVALSGRPESREEANKAGVNAFVSKCASSEELLAVLQALLTANHHVA